MESYSFKSVAFGGFDKQDVVRYLEQASEKAAAAQRKLEEENETLRTQVAEQAEQLDQLRAQLEELTGAAPAPAPAVPAPKAAPAARKQDAVMAAHMNGTVVPMAEVQDEAFATCVLGEGVAIEPAEGKLFAPADAVVDNLFDTHHAIGLVTGDGVEVLLHIGINTVELNGKHFETFVEQGEHVQAGQPLVHFDREAIEQEGYNTQTMVIVTNSAMYEDIELVGQGRVEAGQDVLKRKG